LIELVCKLLGPLWDTLRPLLLGCQWTGSSSSKGGCYPAAASPVPLSKPMMWATGGQGSCSQPCLWASTKPAEKDSLWCRSNFWLVSVKIWQWCSLWFSPFHISLYTHFLICTI